MVAQLSCCLSTISDLEQWSLEWLGFAMVYLSRLCLENKVLQISWFITILPLNIHFDHFGGCYDTSRCRGKPQKLRLPREIYRLVEEDERAIYVPFGEALEKRSGEGCAWVGPEKLR